MIGTYVGIKPDLSPCGDIDDSWCPCWDKGNDWCPSRDRYNDVRTKITTNKKNLFKPNIAAMFPERL